MNYQKSNKILIAIPCLLLGGTEYQTLSLIKSLKEGGYEVTVLCYFEYDERMVIYMQEAGVTVELMTPSGIRPKGLIATGLSLFGGFRKALKKFRPGIIHVQYMAPGSLAILFFKLFGVKHVVTTAHVPGHIYKRKWIPQFIAKYLTDAFICVSKSSEESFFHKKPELFSARLMKEGRKHFTIYNCVEIPEKANKIREKMDAPLIGIVSRLSREKGVDIILDALPLILKSYPTVKLLIVGDGAERDKLEQQAQKLGIKHAIEWAGLQPKENLEKYYRQMDVVVIPSRFEGFGLTAIEAMGYGIPVVASDVDGLREVLGDDAGMLFQQGKPSELAHSLITLLSDLILYEKVAMEGRQRVEKYFSCIIFKQKILDLYEMVGKGMKV
ncbi:glycosyltransferase family 4 protein [Sulfurovum sp. zt1-1]|uniref:Glycosyltransferase family 4 protein n=1 Tax=Sulfurovum zhangzhouensis TaxID=3019067 RepID=A0ABT7R0F4_9BACT|nr:glycosyltransferase family 4 protein [Sulfurovum zhangzhouensis]MDM5272548.1 glycosyltransferase family 4 protein [Sulfurovum zhangzhouensis]